MTRAQRTTAGTAFAVLVVVLLAGWLPGADHPVVRGLAAAFTVAVCWTAAVLCVLAARRGGSRRSRVCWWLQAAACAAWSVGPASWAWYGLVAHTGPQPSALLSASRIAFFVLMFAAVWGTSRASGTRARLRMGLDGLVAAASLFIVAWATLFADIWENAPGDARVGVAVALTYALSDMVLVIFWAVLVGTEFPAGRRRNPFLIMACLVTIMLADGLFTFLVLHDGLPFLAVNPGIWALAFGFFALAALAYRGTTPRRDPATAGSRFALYGPYLPVVPAVLTSVVQLLHDGRLPTAEQAGVLALFATLLVRQLVVLGENRALLLRLAAREADLRHRANHDSLTGLGNRAMLTARLQELLPSPAAPLHLLFLDLDDFKEVNDSLGHLAGDAVLTTVSARLRGVLRDADTVVRLGGDEFAVLIEEYDGDVRALARRVLDLFQEPFEIEGRRVALGCSMGLVEVRAGDERTTVELLRDADIAMYAVKRGGKNDVRLFEPGLHHTTSEELELRADLVSALDAGQLEAAYQPICDAETGAVRGFEALARWTHPVLGPIPPDRFIGIAERAHLSRRITGAMLDRALSDLCSWHRAGAPEQLRVSVNVSAAELADPELPDRLGEALVRHGLRGAHLVVEITETALMDDVDAVVAAIRRIQALGISLAIDDFGTGYSSLARLNTFRVESLKIDKLFVNDLGTTRGLDMVAALVALARSCGMATVAEGVEDQAQLAILRALGIDQVQGYLISRPVPAAQVPGLLDAPMAGAGGTSAGTPPRRPQPVTPTGTPRPGFGASPGPRW